MDDPVLVKIQDANFRGLRNSHASSDISKPVVVLFHGFSFSLNDWQRIGTVAFLSQHGYSSIAIDLPRGKASKSDKISKSNLSQYIPLLQEALWSLGLEKESKIVIVGPSMGGSFALTFALERKEIVQGLVLVAPSTSGIIEEELEAVETPTMLIWGERDGVFPVDTYAKDLKNSLGKSKLLIIKGAGHAAYLDKPQEFHDLLLDFLEEISS